MPYHNELFFEKRRVERNSKPFPINHKFPIWAPSEEGSTSSSSISDEEVETKKHLVDENNSTTKQIPPLQIPKKLIKRKSRSRSKSPEDDNKNKKRMIGPEPPSNFVKNNMKEYRGQFMPGEGQAIANFVQRGMRIPRRGEIGLTSNEIENFETLGYVMSGSRHKRMNAVRIQKENQVYSAEEKKALSVINFEEKFKKEKRLLAEMRKYLKSKVSES